METVLESITRINNRIEKIRKEMEQRVDQMKLMKDLNIKLYEEDVNLKDRLSELVATIK